MPAYALAIAVGGLGHASIRVLHATSRLVEVRQDIDEMHGQQDEIYRVSVSTCQLENIRGGKIPIPHDAGSISDFVIIVVTGS